MAIRQADVSALLNGVHKRTLSFADVINFIDDFYRYTPVGFTNGEQHNAAGDNQASAKVFGFALLHGLNQLDTLTLFAEHYRQVLATPNGNDHANIRNFLHWGWQAFSMPHNPLSPRPSVDTSTI